MKASSTRSRLARATAPRKRARAIEKNTGLYMAAHAQVVVDPTEAEEALLLLMLKDYSKGFGHADLVDLCASTDRRPLE
jgi:hypothetical protein